jgi:hypothetical protein
MKHQIPLLRSNSVVAKEMRIAAVLGILARLVDKYIFQPTYVLDENSGLRGLLRRQAIANDKKESFARGMLLSMFPEEHDPESDAKARKDWVISDLLTEVIVCGFLTPEAARTFGKELEDVLVKAQESWRTVQYSKQRLEPSFRYTHDPSLRWQTLEFPIANTKEGEQPLSPITSDGLEDEPFVIFPRIYIMKSEQQAITAGTVLRSAQLRAAAQEKRENASATPFTQPVSIRHHHGRSRDMSISSEGGQGVSTGKRFLCKGITWT